MKLKIIYDNYRTSRKYRKGWGFSCVIDDRILFDTGEDGRKLLSNLETAGIKTEQLEAVVISHDHWDHTGGLEALLRKKPGLDVYIGPGFGNELKNKIVKAGGNPVVSKGFSEISDSIFLSGELQAKHKEEELTEHFIICSTPKGISVITGCAHPGILKIIEQTKKYFPGKALNIVTGGFHLYSAGKKQALNTVEELRLAGFKNYAGTHCTGKYRKKLNTLDISAGAVLEL